MPRKILLISYHFPPSAEVGGLRIANFARRLPRFGWNPCVLTVKDRYLHAVDLERLDGLVHTKIFKAGRTLTVSQAYLACKKAARRLVQKGDPPSGIANLNGPDFVGPGRCRESVSRRLRRYILSFLSLPDAERNWLLPAVLEAVHIVRRENIECILTSCPPYSTHLVGLLVKWIAGVRWWIADFRDPWMTAGSKSLYPTCSVSLGIERWLERTVVRNADMIIANSGRLCEAFKRAYGSISTDRFVCITNGFDPEYFSGFAQLPKEDVYTITYAGSLYFGRTPEPVFQAVQQLLREGSVEAQSIRIRLVGQCRSVEGRPIDDIVERYGLGNIVEVLEPVPHRQATQMVRQSHLALLLAPNQPYQIPAKVYDYMGAGTRILALAKEGATADLIRGAAGAVFDPSDIAGIKGFIGRSLEESRGSGCLLQPPVTKDFDLDSIARRLAEELGRTCVMAPPPGSASRVSDFHRP
jgi:glycosyltransferase involved in cell wall biosynthesis